MKKVGLVMTIAAIATVLASPSFARNLLISDEDTPIDVEQYCQANYSASAATVSDEDPYSWYCGDDSEATLTDDDMAAACDQQYGAGWVPAIGNELDASSWHCTFEG